MPYEQPTGGPPAATGAQPATEQASRPQTPGRTTAAEPATTTVTSGVAMIQPRFLAYLTVAVLVLSVLTVAGAW